MYRIAVIALALLAACADVTAVPVTSANPNPKGFPAYGTKPILIVTGTTSRIEFIPNLSEKYAIQFRSFLAKNETVLSLHPNGTVESIDTKLDTTDTIPLLQEVLKKTGLVSPLASGDLATGGSVRVFDFVFASDGTVTLREICPSIKVASRASVSVPTPLPGQLPGQDGSLIPVGEG